MKAALESLRQRKGNSCEHLWTEETRDRRTHGEKEKRSRETGQQETAHFHSFHPKNIMVF